MDQSAEIPIPSSVIRHRPFSLFIGARWASISAFQMQGVAIGWQMYALTNSAWYLGLVGLAQFLPMFLLTLVVGHVVDRFDRRVIARICQAIQGVAAGVLAYGSFVGRLRKEEILAIAFIAGAARAFEAPAMQALVPRLVPALLLSRAVAWSAAALQAATILGPALGGILYVFGPAVVYSVNGILFLAASAFLGMFRLPAVSATAPLQATMSSLFAGIAFIRANRAILGAISLDMCAVLLGGATALLPIYARDILHTGPWGLGLLRAAPGLGALAMSFYLTQHPLRSRIGRVMFSSVAVFGMATCVFAVSTSFILSLGALIILGAADVISVVIRATLVQLQTPDEMRGRVTAVNSLFIGTSNQLGEFESGATAALFGTLPAVLIGGIGTLMVTLIWMRIFPQLLRTEHFERSP